MRYLGLIVFTLFTLSIKAQGIKALEETGVNDSIPSGQSIIYGNFIQRLGFSSGGFPQDIRIVNRNTGEVFAFRVKPTFKSAKENTFIYFIKPGTYTILNYWWTQSKWYGGKMFTEPIYKKIDGADNLEQKLASGKIRQEDLEQFTFEVSENSLNYVGTWNFDKGIVSFSDDKMQLDSLIQGKFKKLSFSGAKTQLPN